MASWRMSCVNTARKADSVEMLGSTYWRKWTAKHEYEEVKEGTWLEPALALLRKTKDEWTDKHRHVARKLVLEGGWVRQMKANLSHKVQKSTGFAIVQVGMKSGAKSQRPAGSGSKKRGPQRRNGSGKEVLLRIF